MDLVTMGRTKCGVVFARLPAREEWRVNVNDPESLDRQFPRWYSMICRDWGAKFWYGEF